MLVVVLEVVELVVVDDELLDDELLEVVVSGGDVLLELAVVELVVVDDELLEVVVVDAGVPSQATVATYPLYGPSCPGAGPHVQPLSHVLNPPGYHASASASQTYVHWPTHPGINHLQSK